VDVATPDVPAFPAVLRSVEVDPAEEECRRRVVHEAGSPSVQGHGEELVRDPVTARGAHADGLLAHPGELLAGVREIVLLAAELRFGGHDEGPSTGSARGGSAAPYP